MLLTMVQIAAIHALASFMEMARVRTKPVLAPVT
jgi:hypothetical protein